MGKVYVGDVGTQVRVDMQEDLTGYSVVKLYVRKPNGSLAEWIPTVVPNAAGLNSVLGYISLPGDLNVRGLYKIQPYVEFASWKGRGTPVYLEVFGEFT